MKFAVVIFACAVAAVSAQFSFGQYPTSKGQFHRQYANERKPTPAPYRPYVPVSTVAPVAPRSTVAPRKPVAPVAPVAVSLVAPVAVAIPKVYADARNADILKYSKEINPDGGYNYFYETSNGIAAQEQGIPRNFGGNPPVIPDVAQGSFSWTSPEGTPILITYTADENGYQASGNAIPTPPPIPPQIARALEYIARTAKN